MKEYDIKDYQKQQEIVQTKIEYAYGILMEKGDRLIDDDYDEGVSYYKKANKLFTESKELSLALLSNRYPNFIQWMKKDLYINFKKEDISDLYWLTASMAGSIQSSRGANPYELINIPIIGKLLETAIALDPKWGGGSLQAAMMSYSSIRPDLSRGALKDTVDFYFKKALELSDSLDASIFVSYAELIHKPRQEKKDFESKLLHVIGMNINLDKERKINNLIAIKRAKWLLSKKEDYFL